MFGNSIVEKLNKVIQKELPDKEIVQIVDYKDKGLYVVCAVPKKLVSDKNEWVNQFYSFDRKTLKYLGAFTSMVNDINTYFDVPGVKVLYRRL